MHSPVFFASLHEDEQEFLQALSALGEDEVFAGIRRFGADYASIVGPEKWDVREVVREYFPDAKVVSQSARSMAIELAPSDILPVYDRVIEVVEKGLDAMRAERDAGGICWRFPASIGSDACHAVMLRDLFAPQGGMVVMLCEYGPHFLAKGPEEFAGILAWKLAYEKERVIVRFATDMAADYHF